MEKKVSTDIIFVHFCWKLTTVSLKAQVNFELPIVLTLFLDIFTLLTLKIVIKLKK